MSTLTATAQTTLPTTPPATYLPIRRRFSPARLGAFFLHFLEMCAVMCLGMILNPLYSLIAGRLGYANAYVELPEFSLFVVTLNMTAPMALWMRFRGMGWKCSIEMSAAMVVELAALIAGYWAGILPNTPIGVTSSLMLLQHGLMMPAMLIPMLLRYDHYANFAYQDYRESGTALIARLRAIRAFRPGAKGRFFLHFIEMAVVMEAGMVLYHQLARRVPPEYAGLVARGTTSNRIGMAVAMTVPMVLWMRYRGHAWRHATEMGALMLAPYSVVILLCWLGLDQPAPWLPLTAMPLMYAGMLGGMLYRREHYTGSRAPSHGDTAGAAPSPAAPTGPGP